MSKKRTLAFLLVLLFALPLMAADSTWDNGDGILSVEEALGMAKKNNVSLQVAQVQLNTAIRNADAVSSTYMPKIDLNGSIGTTTGGWQFINNNNNATPGLTYNVGLSASMPFSGNMVTDGRTRSLAKTSANLAYETKYNSLEEGVIDAYWNLVACDTAVQIAKQSYESAKMTAETTRESYEAGLTSELMLVQSEYNLSDAELNVKQLEDQKKLALLSFEILTGIEDASIYKLEDLPETVYLSFPTPMDIYSKYASGSLSIRTSQNSLSSAENASETQKWSSWAPTFTVSASYGINQTPITAKPGNPIVPSSTELGDGLSLTASLSIPISSYIPGSSQYLAIQDKDDAVTEARLNLKNAQDTLLNSITSDVQSIVLSQEQLDLLNKNIEQARYSYQLSEEAYEGGLITNKDLNDSRLTLLTAELNLVSTRLDHLSNCYSLAYLLGIDLETLQNEYPYTESATVQGMEN